MPENQNLAQNQNPVSNLARINEQIEKASKTAGRSTRPTITAVSKKHDASKILPLLEIGHKVFGENRVQEAMGKWPPLLERFENIDLRLIGPLQSNKAKEAVSFFTTIETIDRPKIARAIANEMMRQEKSPDLYIQINTGEESQKAGIAPMDAEKFIAQCRNEFDLTIKGLMCIPPAGAVCAPHFALLKKIAINNGVDTLSMGMSADFIDATKLGADYLRIGSAIFGARNA